MKPCRTHSIPEGKSFCTRCHKHKDDIEIEQYQTKLAEQEAELQKLRALLYRYRHETPLGHQPHMIAHEVDSALRAAGKLE